MMLRASVYLHFDHVAVNVWIEEEPTPGGPVVIKSVRHTYAEVPEVLADLPESEQCLEALRWAVVTAIRERSARARQLGD